MDLVLSTVLPSAQHNRQEVIVDLRRNSSTVDATNNKSQTVDYMQSFVFWGY